MQIDWQTTYYMIASISMGAVFFVAIYLFFLIHQLYSKLRAGVDKASTFGTLVKVGFLRTLLKTFR